MSFYELRGRQLLKTVAVMDEIEGAVFLSEAHAARLLGLQAPAQSTGNGAPKTSQGGKAKLGKASGGPSTHVLVVGGSRGQVRLNKVVFADGGLACTPLGSFGVSSVGMSVSSTGSSSSSSGSGSSSSSAQAIGSLHYLASSGQVMCVTADSHFFHFAIQPGAMSASRQYTGSHDEVLDIACLAGGGGSGGGGSGRLAVATNSPIVRVVAAGLGGGGELGGAGAGYQLLYGHTDIVLALDASPDGCVAFC